MLEAGEAGATTQGDKYLWAMDRHFVAVPGAPVQARSSSGLSKRARTRRAASLSGLLGRRRVQRRDECPSPTSFNTSDTEKDVYGYRRFGREPRKATKGDSFGETRSCGRKFKKSQQPKRIRHECSVAVQRHLELGRGALARDSVYGGESSRCAGWQLQQS